MRHNFKKIFGQNFLRSERFVEKLIAPLECSEGDLVIEIGPGDGIVTNMLLERNVNVVSIDVDFDLIPKLIKRFEGRKNFHIIHEDFLQVNIDSVIDDAVEKFGLKDFRIFFTGSLPYNISKSIISIVLEHNSYSEKYTITSASFIVQDEVAKLYSAKSPKNTLLATTSRIYSRTKKFESIPPTQFFPKPKVSGGIVFFDLLEKPKVSIEILNDFKKLLKIGYILTRKTVYNNLRNSKKFDSSKLTEVLEPYGLKVRATELELEDWIDIYKKLTL